MATHEHQDDKHQDKDDNDDLKHLHPAWCADGRSRTGLVAAVDLFSVFAGLTRTLVENESPSLDYFLLWFPTFGRPRGCSLGVSDFVSLAAFTAIARQFSLCPLASLALACVATVLDLLAALLVARPLPALPFIAFSFILADIDPLLRGLLRKE